MNGCFFFFQGLVALEDGEIRTRILSKFEQNSKISLQMAEEECERIEKLRNDTSRIEERDMSKINAVKRKQRKICL